MNIALDLDGTLITCAFRQSILLKYILKIYEQNVNVWDIWGAKRIGVSGYNALIAIGVSDYVAKAVMREWVARVEDQYWLGFDEVHCSTFSFLAKLHDVESRKTILLTARRDKYQLYNQLKKLDLLRQFNEICVVSPANAINEKNEILQRERIKLFVGDTETDFFATSNTNCRFIGVSTGQRSKKYLEKVGAFVVDDLMEIELSEIRQV